MPTSGFDPFFDLSQDLLGVLDSDGQFVRINTSFERDLGWGLEALAGRTFVSLIHDGDVPATSALLRDLPPDGSPCAFTALIAGSAGP